MDTDHLVKFDSPALYRIAVNGRLDEDALIMLGVDDHQEQILANKVVTSIKVYVKDQAQLAGILNILYDRHHSLLRVECADPD